MSAERETPPVAKLYERTDRNAALLALGTVLQSLRQQLLLRETQRLAPRMPSRNADQTGVHEAAAVRHAVVCALEHAGLNESEANHRQI